MEGRKRPEKGYQILTDSVCDLPASWLAEHPEITVVDTPIIASAKDEKGKAYARNMVFSGLMSADEFCEVDKYVKQGYVTTTSSPVIYETEGEEECGLASVERLTREYLEMGKDVIYLAMNSAISGTFSCVYMLFEQMRESGKYAGRVMTVVDTECASTGLGFLIRDMLDKREMKDVQSVEMFVRRNGCRVAHVFTWGEFSYVVKSGKVRALPAFLGKVFRLHPLCSAEYVEEHTRPLMTISGTIRGKYRFLDTFAKFVRATIAREDGEIVVAHGNFPEGARLIADAILEYLPEARMLCGPEWRCGAAIQAHGGPSSIHVNYYRNVASYGESMEIFAGL